MRDKLNGNYYCYKNRNSHLSKYEPTTMCSERIYGANWERKKRERGEEREATEDETKWLKGWEWEKHCRMEHETQPIYHFQFENNANDPHTHTHTQVKRLREKNPTKRNKEVNNNILLFFFFAERCFPQPSLYVIYIFLSLNLLYSISPLFLLKPHLFSLLIAGYGADKVSKEQYYRFHFGWKVRRSYWVMYSNRLNLLSFVANSFFFSFIFCIHVWRQEQPNQMEWTLPPHRRLPSSSS